MAINYLEFDNTADAPVWDTTAAPVPPITHMLRIVDATGAISWSTAAVPAFESNLRIESTTDVLSFGS